MIRSILTKTPPFFRTQMIMHAMGIVVLTAAFLLLSATQAMAANVTVTVNWPTQANQNIVRIYDEALSSFSPPEIQSGGAGTYSFMQNYTLADGVTYQFVMFDTTNDGWNGGTVTVSIDGVEVLTSNGPPAGTLNGYTIARFFTPQTPGTPIAGDVTFCSKAGSEVDMQLGYNAPSLAKLRNSTYFGPTGRVAPETIGFRQLASIDVASLNAAGCDAYIGGGDKALGEAEADAVHAWLSASASRYMIGACDYSFNTICSRLRTSVDGTNGGVSINSALSYNPLTCGGALGVTTYGGASAYFAPQAGDVTLGTHNGSVGIPSNAILTDQVNGGSFIMLPDADMLGNAGNAAGGITPGSTVTSDQDKLVVNVFKFALDEIAGRSPTACIADYNNDPGIISGVAYLDINGDDSYQSGSETVLANITVELWGDPGTPTDTSDDLKQATMATDANGAYSFSASQELTYRIEIDTNDPDLPLGATIGTASSLTSVNVLSGATTANQNFGFDLPDRADAPNSGTAPSGTGTNAYGDAVHGYVSALRLGAALDGEVSNPSSADASGDGADDDGLVTIPPLRTGRTSYTIPAADFATGAGDGNLYAWVDIDGSGTFDTDEFASTTVMGGVVQGDLVWSLNDLMEAGTTFARFRLTTNILTAAAATTLASDGEVEDYAVAVTLDPLNFSCQARVDIWYGNDESGSVSASEFRDARDFIYQVSDGFYHSFSDGAQGGIIGWAFSADPVDVIMPITETFFDRGDTGLVSTGLNVDGDNQGVREQYTAKVDRTGGTQLANATNGLANRINAGNGRRIGVPQIAVILTDAPDFQINNVSYNGGGSAWEAAAENLRNAGPDGTRIVLILLAEAAIAYQNNAAARATIESVAGTTGKIIETASYVDAANPTKGFIQTTVDDICASATFPPTDLDYSDAPTTNTSYASASHLIDSAIRLGATVTPETAPYDTINADGDVDDGITIPVLAPGASAMITASTFGAGGNLQAWIDWNGDGDFLDIVDGVNERIATDLTDGDADNLISIPVTVPLSASQNQTIARFRWSTMRGLGPTDVATDGEVEDYALTIAAPILSCPAPVASGLADGLWWFDWTGVNVSSSPVTKNFTLPDGRSVDARITPISGSGVEGLAATGRPLESLASGIGTNFASVLPALGTTTPAAPSIFSVDFFEGGTITPLPLNIIAADGEATGSSEGLGATTNGGVWEVIDSFSTGRYHLGGAETQTWAMRGVGGAPFGTPLLLSRQASNITTIIDDSPNGSTAIAFGVQLPDTGDAPASYGVAAHNFANAIPSCTTFGNDTIYIGTVSPDGEYPANNQGSTATGDNTNGTRADEDGVTISAMPIGGGGTITVDVNGSGFLQGWIDFDGSGMFDSPVEQIATDLQDFGTGTITIPVAIPTWAVAGQTYARFRWSSDPSITETGYAPDGEGEDYVLTLGAAGTRLSGTVFIDNGAGGGAAHDAIIQTGEVAGPYAVISITAATTGAVLATVPAGPGGTWSATLPAGFSGNVQLTATPEARYLSISEATPGLPGLTNPSRIDGAYTFTPSANTVYDGLDFGVIAMPVLSQDQSVGLTPGQVTNLSHRYEATSAGLVSFALVDEIGNPVDAFVTTLYLDATCDGTLDGVVSTPIPVSAGQSVCVIARTQSSPSLGPGSGVTYGITAETVFSGSMQSILLRNNDSIGATNSEKLVLRKLVRNTSVAGAPEMTSNTGGIGDVLEYRIIMSNQSTETVRNVKVHDSTPAWTTLSAAIVSPVTVAPGVDCTVLTPNTVGYAGPIEWNCLGDFLPGSEASVKFSVQISP